MRALKHGQAPDGSHYYPVFPYTAYTRMQSQDIHDLWMYLHTVKPLPKQNKAHELPWYLRWRLVNWFWKLLYFNPGDFKPRTDQSQAWNRGAYLTAIAHCTECHTPRNRLGALDETLLFAGAKLGPEDEITPNITPDRATGIGKWSQDDLRFFLRSGQLPDGDIRGIEGPERGFEHTPTGEKRILAAGVGVAGDAA